MEDKDLRQAMMVLESYNEQLEVLRQQIELVQYSLEESVRARETLRVFKDAKEGEEILIPIGASVFVNAKVTNSDKAIIGVGNKISITKDIPGAADYMNSIAIELQEALKKVSSAYSELQIKTNKLSAAINAEYEAKQKA
ncbi:MAG TPA: prefoldin subunit alpha [Candidatus Methanomethylophilaceae archaeon]|nr:prefoldin subunit alpha [Candidatus Methanomethylophilaceae archaeon]